MIRKTIASLAVVFATTASAAHADTLSFDDGIDGELVGSFYSGLGVTFSNAEWTENFGLPGSSGTLGIRAPGTFEWQSDNAVVAVFGASVGAVRITGIDVGQNGLRMDAYDATVGGTLVDLDAVFGLSDGAGQFYDIAVSASLIRRVEIYQINPSLGDNKDGILLENLLFHANATAVPIPPAMALFATGLAGLGWLARRRKKQAA
jgi:uncharacterized protein (TIGR03382 family)